MRHHLHTEIDIEAPPEVVWDILIDLDKYEEWNPFVVAADGTPEVGEKLVNRLEPPDGKAMTFRPKVTVVEPAQTFEWLGRLGAPGVFDGRHRFALEPTATGTRLTQTEDFSGVLVRPMRRGLDDRTARGFEKMNDALKARAEARAGSAR
jgi:hypothetical protein